MDAPAGPPLISRVPPRWWYAADWVAALAWGLVTFGQLAAQSTGRAALMVTPLALAASSVPMVLRRRWPVSALVAVVTCDLVLQLAAPTALAGGVTLVPLTFVLYLVAATRRPRVAGLALVVALGTAGAMALPDFVHIGGSVLFSLILGTAWTVGYAVGMHRRYAAHLLEQQRRVTAAETEAARARVFEERLAIARELHDVVAHSMSVVTVQAAYGRMVLDDEPEAARAALEAIETTGRAGLVDLRRLLGVFRAERVPTPELEPYGRAPAPGLAALAELIEQTAVGGVRVELRVEGAAIALEPGVDVSAYRIVQEALTNVVRHSSARTATTRLTYRPDALLIEVSDGGPVRSGAVGPTPGHGLVGMRERVTLLGGRLAAGPRPDGGFQVVAEIPLSEAQIGAPARPVEPAAVA